MNGLRRMGRGLLAAGLLWCAGLALAQPLPQTLPQTHTQPHTQPQTQTLTQAQTPGARRPNLVILLADDWGFTDVGAFGGEMATPHLDALARRGMRFSNFHVAASCSPSRAMLLTGVDNHLNGVGNMRESIPREHIGKPGYLSVLNQRVVTVSTRLQEAGYRTYASGKWHIGKEPHNLPPARGFDRSIIQADSGSDNWDSQQRYLALTEQVNWFENGAPAQVPRDYYSSQYFVDRAIEFLRADAASGKPFFAYVAFQANHIPLQAPRSFIDKYRGRYDAGWEVLRKERRDKAAALGLIPADAAMQRMASTRDWNALSSTEKAYEARRMEVYAAMAEAMDFQVGRLIAYLREAGEYDNTVFMFLSDNGAEPSDPYATFTGRLWLATQYNREIERLGDKGAYAVIGPSWASAAASPLSTYKFYSGEGGIRVPLIIAGAPGIAAGTVHSRFVHVTDLAPTLLQLADVAMPQGRHRGRDIEPMRGRSLLPVMQGKADRVHPVDEPIGYELSGNQALFLGDLKLIRNIAPVGDGRWHLYDILRDPGETRDLQAEQPAMFQRMQALYEDYARQHGVLPMPPGYEPTRQVLINSIHNVYLPRILRWGAPMLGALLLWGLWRRGRQRRRRALPPAAH